MISAVEKYIEIFESIGLKLTYGFLNEYGDILKFFKKEEYIENKNSIEYDSFKYNTIKTIGLNLSENNLCVIKLHNTYFEFVDKVLLVLGLPLDYCWIWKNEFDIYILVRIKENYISYNKTEFYPNNVNYINPFEKLEICLSDVILLPPSNIQWFRIDYNFIKSVPSTFPITINAKQVFNTINVLCEENLDITAQKIMQLLKKTVIMNKDLASGVDVISIKRVYKEENPITYDDKPYAIITFNILNEENSKRCYHKFKNKNYKECLNFFPTLIVSLDEADLIEKYEKVDLVLEKMNNNYFIKEVKKT